MYGDLTDRTLHNPVLNINHFFIKTKYDLTKYGVQSNLTLQLLQMSRSASV